MSLTLSSLFPDRQFVRHYLEMVVAMLLGMAVLYLPFEALVALAGTDDLSDDAPAVAFLGMFAAMTIPMVAWMRHRGHAWRPCWEMSGAMLAPTLAAIALLGLGAGDFHALMGLEHAAMFVAMYAVMLARREEYSGHNHG